MEVGQFLAAALSLGAIARGCRASPTALGHERVGDHAGVDGLVLTGFIGDQGSCDCAL